MFKRKVTLNIATTKYEAQAVKRVMGSPLFRPRPTFHIHNPSTRGRAHAIHEPVPHTHNDDTTWRACDTYMNSHATYL